MSLQWYVWWGILFNVFDMQTVLNFVEGERSCDLVGKPVFITLIVRFIRILSFL